MGLSRGNSESGDIVKCGKPTRIKGAKFKLILYTTGSKTIVILYLKLWLLLLKFRLDFDNPEELIFGDILLS